jgi:dihydrofolate reductase
MTLAKQSADAISKTRCFPVIAAIAENGTIGLYNKISWHIPEELNFSSKHGSGTTVRFRRKTFESIGTVLPNRKNVIRSPLHMIIPRDAVVHCIEELLDLAGNVGGGDSIYQLLSPAGFCSAS